MKTILISETRKCLKCGTYHKSTMERCPVCDRYLYACGDIYQPKIKRKEGKVYA